MIRISRFLNLFLVVSFCLLLTACPQKKQEKKETPENITEKKERKQPEKKKKVLIVDSYHKGYFWGDSTLSGAFQVFNVLFNADDTLDCSKSDYDVKLFRMDTKRNTSEEFKKEAALKAKKLIDAWKPDIVIACDDNASKYLVVPYLKGKNIPVIFCGLNHGASEYGFPCKNITGIIEVSTFPQLVPVARKFAKGDRIAYLAPEVVTNRRTLRYLKETAKIKFEHEVYVKNVDEWKKAFLDLQDKADMLIVINLGGLKGDFTKEEIQKFTDKNTAIPTLSELRMVAPLTVFCFSKYPSEQGERAAKMAVKVLSGTLPEDIALEQNKGTRIFLNMKLAEKLGIKMPKELIEKAHFVEECRTGF